MIEIFESKHGLRLDDMSIVLLEPPPNFWTNTSWLQLGYGVWVNMTVLCVGLAFGFPAVTIPQLREDLGFKTTLSEEAWIASVLTLSSPIGSLICGILMDKYGRKLVLVLCEIPLCFGWLYTGYASCARDIIIGRLIAGVGIGMAMSAPRAYITEITLPNMRGVIGALPNLAISIGLTFQAGLGSVLKWSTLCYISGVFSFILLIANSFLPDTPYFLLLKSSPTNARINLRRFRSAKFNVDAELNELYDFKAVNNIRRLSMKDQIKMLFKASSCKPYGIATVYICITQFAGVNVVISWAVEMLKSANSSMDPNLGNFILAITRIVFGVVMSILLFKVKRRVMALTSAIGVGLAAIGLCVFLHTTTEKSLLPQFLLMSYIAFATLGYYTLPFLMMFELIPLQLRGLLSGICISQLNLLMFAMNNTYPFLRHTLGLANTMALFGGFSLVGALILYFILPETKDLTLQEIEEYFNTRRPTLVSQRKVMSMQLASRSMSGYSKSNLNLKSDKKTSKERKQKDSRGLIKSKSMKDLSDGRDWNSRSAANLSKDSILHTSNETSLKSRKNSTVTEYKDIQSDKENEQAKMEDSKTNNESKEPSINIRTSSAVGDGSEQDNKNNLTDKLNINEETMEGTSREVEEKDKENTTNKDPNDSSPKSSKDPSLKSKKSVTVVIKDLEEDDSPGEPKK